MLGKLVRVAAVALAFVALPATAQNSVNVNINTGGQRVRLTTSVSDLRWYGFGDRTESFRAHGRWRLCSQTNFRGHCTSVRGNRSSLGATAGGRVRSARFLGN